MEKIMKKQIHRKDSERGNVLFLILIAVALFAALSYAVTKSTRSGSGSPDRERAILGSAGMTQHPTAMRTAVIRMILGGTDVNNLLFNSPSDFGAIAGSENLAVFHVDGGGALYQDTPADVMADAQAGVWNFNLDFRVPEIGGEATEDLIAFLPGVTEIVCEQVNREFNIDMTNCDTNSGAYPTIPTGDTGVTIANVSVNMDDTYTASGPVELKGVNDGGTCRALNGQASGCFVDLDGANPDIFIYYSILLER